MIPDIPSSSAKKTHLDRLQLRLKNKSLHTCVFLIGRRSVGVDRLCLCRLLGFDGHGDEVVWGRGVWHQDHRRRHLVAVRVLLDDLELLAGFASGRDQRVGDGAETNMFLVNLFLMSLLCIRLKSIVRLFC